MLGIQRNAMFGAMAYQWNAVEGGGGAGVGSRTAQTVTAINNAQVDTAYSQFGGSSLKVDGVDDALTALFDNTFDASGDFCIELWARGSGYSTRGKMFATYPHHSSLADSIFVDVNNGNTIRCYINGANRVTTGTWSNTTWTHVALQRTGQVFEMFVGGTRVLNYDGGTPKDYSMDNSASFHLGGTFSSGSTYNDEWNGHFDELRFSDTARYTSGSSITVPPAPFVNDANTLLLLHMDGANGDTTFTDDITTGAATTTYRSDTYANNVYLALPFDETNQFNDVSTEINSGSTTATSTQGANSAITMADVLWNGAPSYGKSLENLATSGTASMTYALSTSIPSASSGTYVIEGWFNADNATTNANWAISSSDVGGRFLFGINTGSSFTFGNENNIGIGTGWHHLAIVCDGGTKRFYYDGIYKGAWVSSNTGFSTIHIGQFNAGDNNDYRGHIQDFRVTIGSNRGYTGTGTGTANFTLPGSIVESFSAAPAATPYTADGIVIPSSARLYGTIGTNNASSSQYQFTFSAWVKHDGTNFTYVWCGSNSNYAFAGGRVAIGATGFVQYYGYNGANNGWVTQISTADYAVPANTWTHIAVAFDNTSSFNNGVNAQIYVNGTSQSVTNTRFNTNANLGFDLATDMSLHGRRIPSSVYSSGAMSYAQVWIDDTFVDLSSNIGSFIDVGTTKPVDMGTDGTMSGLAAPMIYHYGDTSTFYNNNGRTTGNNITYTFTAQGGTITDTDTDS